MSLDHLFLMNIMSLLTKCYSKTWKYLGHGQDVPCNAAKWVQPDWEPDLNCFDQIIEPLNEGGENFSNNINQL